MRGNPRAGRRAGRALGSIPAYAGKPKPGPGLLEGGFRRRQILFQLLKGGNIARAGLGFLDDAAEAVKLLYTTAQHSVR